MAKRLRHPEADELLVRLGANVRRARMGAGLSQEALAAESGVAQSMISRIEAGKQEPGILTARLLARGLGLQLSDLMAGLERRA